MKRPLREATVPTGFWASTTPAPWKRPEEWPERLVYRYQHQAWNPATGCLWSLAALVVAFVVSLLVEPLLFLFALVGVPVVWMLKLADRARLRPYEVVCDLQTIPALIGGAFKANIEVTMGEPPTGFTASLLRSGKGKSNEGAWTTEMSVPLSDVNASGGKYRFSVDLPIALMTHLPDRPWSLLVNAQCERRMAHYAGIFPVPVEGPGFVGRSGKE